MHAIMLAAGVGARLKETSAASADEHPPKILLAFGGRSLLARHLANLRAVGVEKLVLVTGYRADDIAAAIAAEGAVDFVETIFNPDFRAGSVASLAAANPVLTAGGDVLLMDADVLYGPDLIARLMHTGQTNCFLLDREFEPGEEPVKLCVSGGELVDFRKQVGTGHDFQGESVGFFRFGPAVAARLAATAGAYLGAGRSDEPYEEVIRDVLLEAAPGTFGWEDVTGMPWIEIDFAEDVARAEAEILPRIEGAD